MSEAIVNYDVRSLIDEWMEQEQKGISFPVPFDVAWQIAGYSNKANAKRALPKSAQGALFIKREEKTKGRPKEIINLSTDGLKHICLMSETEEGYQIRQYFIEAEKKWRMVQSVAPEFATQVELTQLQLELERERNKGKQLDATMLALHGDRVVLALRGQSDVIVEKETVITEVVEPATGKTSKIMTAEQLKKAVLERTGQKLKSLKHFADSLRDAGRDDLLIPVTRHQTNEYPIPDKLDEAIAVVYGKCRQKLIGE